MGWVYRTCECGTGRPKVTLDQLAMGTPDCETCGRDWDIPEDEKWSAVQDYIDNKAAGEAA